MTKNFKYYIQEPGEACRGLSKIIIESYIWDLLTDCHGRHTDHTFYAADEGSAEAFRRATAAMLRKIAYDIEHLTQIRPSGDDK